MGVIMETIFNFLFVISNILFTFLGFSILYSFFHTKNFIYLVAGLIYLSATTLSINLSAWWPLIIGLLLAHMLRFSIR